MGMGERGSTDEELAEALSRIDMNRDRALDTYSRLLGIDIRTMAITAITNDQDFTWYDMCCGNFNAGQELKYSLRQDDRYYKQVDKVVARGIDVDTQQPGDDKHFGAIITRGNALNFPIPPDVNLITCLHGLSYIQSRGNGLEAIEYWYNNLPLNSTLAFDYPYEFLPKSALESASSQLGNAMSVTYRGSFAESVYAVNIVRQDSAPLFLSIT